MRPDYAGARGLVSLSALPSLGPRWALQPKIDGCYVTALLDGDGRIAELRARSGRVLGDLAGDVLGVLAGRPWSILVGEYEAMTEAGERAAMARGYRCLHLFDCVQAGLERVAERPYRERRDRLYAMHAELEDASLDRPWHETPTGKAKDDRGRWTRAIPRSWRRVPIVEQLPSTMAGRAWAEWVEGPGGEGLVAVNLDAPMGRRRAKRKCKLTDTLDAVVAEFDPKLCLLVWRGHPFIVSRGRHEPNVGDIVSVAYNGFFERQVIPRFPRIVSVRQDLRSSQTITFPLT